MSIFASTLNWDLIDIFSEIIMVRKPTNANLNVRQMTMVFDLDFDKLKNNKRYALVIQL